MCVWLGAVISSNAGEWFQRGLVRDNLSGIATKGEPDNLCLIEPAVLVQ